MIGQKFPNSYKGKTVAQMLAAKEIAKPNPYGVSYTTIPHSTEEGQRNWNIQSWLGRKNFMGNDVTRVELPNDTDKTQQLRNAEWFRQAAMPWGNHFMVTATDKERLNNLAQASAMKQKQYSDPSTYGQFYAFMHALSAAFGTVGKS